MQKKYFSLLLIVILSIAFPLVVLFITDQETILQKIFLIFVVFFIVGIILILLFPVINEIAVEYLQQKPVYYLLVLGVLIVPLLNLFFIDDFSFVFNAVLSSYAIWYLLPALIMIFPTFSQKIKPFGAPFHIIGVIILAVGFDNRSTGLLMSGFVDMEYAFNALWVSAVILVIISTQFDEFVALFNWKITPKNVTFPLVLLVIAGIILLPFGLLSGFITWAINWDGIGTMLLTFAGIWFTIALPEELIARGVIQNQMLKFSKEKINIEKYKKIQTIVIILIASFIFGLSHWNNTSAEFVWVYIGLATVAGFAFGWCWEKRGLFSAMFMHTLIDFTWAMCFSG
ncbi:MAG: CPBP family glutamic-type intramembrane protease [Promethearchaeota archaeon]